MEFIRNNTLLNQLFIVDGIGRSGKVLFSDILSCFSTVEVQQYVEFIEYISLAFYYDKISEDIAQAIIKTQLDTQLYNLMIGRSINSRPNDSTSYLRYHSPAKYISRTTSPDGPIIGDKVLQEKPIYLIWTHDLIYKSELMFKTFADKITYFYLNRNPIDIIYEWDLKNFGRRIGNDTTERQYLLKYNGEVVPELALGWEKDYLRLNSLERIVRMIHSSFNRNVTAIEKNKHRDNFVIINFEELVTSPISVITKIGELINLEPLPILSSILARENCPRKLDVKQTISRRNKIADGISKDIQIYLDEAVKMHEAIK